MASLLIRNVDPVLHSQLKARAATHRRSLEEEARELLRAGVARQEMPSRENLVDLARSMASSSASRAVAARHRARRQSSPPRTTIRPANGDPPRHQRDLRFGAVSANPAVVAFVRGQAPETVFTAAVCEAGIRYGIARMPPGRKRDDLMVRITAFFGQGFRDQILPFDSACAALYGDLRAAREAAGKAIAVEDVMIAATARAHGAAVATRNIVHFQDCGVAVIDPWAAGQ
ncbi:MAG: PIN domain-containing protein [Pseudomonadota bacterium]|nr:PIN domain-containing protein [Pseudomonadota bacterium]